MKVTLDDTPSGTIPAYVEIKKLAKPLLMLPDGDND